MQLVLLDLFLAEELVDYMLGHIQTLRLQTELAMDIDYPFQ